jgi:peptidoglycan-associated lipoprotein
MVVPPQFEHLARWLATIAVMKHTIISVLLLGALFGSACSSSTGAHPGQSNVNGDEPLCTLPVPESIVIEPAYFSFDSALLDQAATTTLKADAVQLKRHFEGKHIEIEGHCDERGTNEYNLVLGERRARAVADFVIALGVPKELLSTVSYGEELPLDPRHQEDAWARNRRVELKVLKELP